MLSVRFISRAPNTSSHPAGLSGELRVKQETSSGVISGYGVGMDDRFKSRPCTACTTDHKRLSGIGIET